jgi:hypothetical protein
LRRCSPVRRRKEPSIGIQTVMGSCEIGHRALKGLGRTFLARQSRVGWIRLPPRWKARCP